jgi:hypothetical protein
VRERERERERETASHGLRSLITRSVQFGQVNRVASVGFDPELDLAVVEGAPNTETLGILLSAALVRLSADAGLGCGRFATCNALAWNRPAAMALA